MRPGDSGMSFQTLNQYSSYLMKTSIPHPNILWTNSFVKYTKMEYRTWKLKN